MSLPLAQLVGPGPWAIATETLVKRYGRTTALAAVDLRVPYNAVYLLVGPNGAGKSTLLRTLMDLAAPDLGSASVMGLDTRDEAARVRAQIGFVPERQDAGLRWMTAGAMLKYQAAFYPTWDHGYADRLTRAFEVPLGQRCGNLSKGHARRLQLVLAMAHRPPVLLLDEPTDGLDPVTRDQTLALLAEHIADTPTTVLVSTHRVYELEGLSDHLGVLRGGRLLAQVERSRLGRMLRRYRVEVTEGWVAPESLNGAVLERSGLGREIVYTIWGREPEVREQLINGGATIREVASLNLDQAALTLLKQELPT